MEMTCGAGEPAEGLAGGPAPVSQHHDEVAQDMEMKFHPGEEPGVPGSPEVLTWCQVCPPSSVSDTALGERT
jgi:hypothetical protein